MTDTTTDVFEVVHANTSALERPEWLRLRKQGIGSSDAAGAMGLSPYSSPYSIWAEKSGYLPEQPDKDRFWWGREIEPLILRFGTEHGWWKGYVRHVMFRSVERPWMLANPDALVPDAVIECKTISAFDERRWDAGVPDQYVIQGLWLMAVTGKTRCHFPVFFGDHAELFTVEWADHLDTVEVMLAAGADLWRRVLENDPPDPDASEASMLAVRARWETSEPGKSIDLDVKEWAHRIHNRATFAALTKDAVEHVDGTKTLLMEEMGDAEVARLDGEVVATWRTSKNGRRTFRWKETI